MSKREPKAMRSIYGIVKPAFKSMTVLGILEGSTEGDGYHHSYEDLVNRGRVSAYSIKHKLDRVAGTAQEDAAAGIDFGFNAAEMVVATSRLLIAAQAKDPRVYLKVREFGGTLDGPDVALSRRRVTAYNVTEQRFVPFDSSHKTHVHVSVHRSLVDNAEVCQGIAEVICGIPLGGKEDNMSWPKIPYKSGQRVKVTTPAGLKARTAPWVAPETELRRNGKAVTVAQGYPIVVKKIAFVDGRWWIGSTYWYAAEFTQAF